ncbi:hypothetical protein [Cryptosporangium aurantiacum]|uniref:Uncharacterized protein n=1 Tax=Cryptosporangium aurantiacum TaxID=134849 RepID=A0A1M7TW03_9ACTN|nr:hypothetical protein [Cryptosporangium aurantiacum]SHN74896.1 hypothetical protein SAMN05443668_107170 [Cryptosporangium aurantiacum]
MVAARISLYCGVFGALGATFGWFLWAATLQIRHEPGEALLSVAVGATVGTVAELALRYRAASKRPAEPPPEGRRGAARFLVFPAAALVAQVMTENVVSELVKAVLQPFVVSLAAFFVGGALLGLLLGPVLRMGPETYYSGGYAPTIGPDDSPLTRVGGVVAMGCATYSVLFWAVIVLGFLWYLLRSPIEWLLRASGVLRDADRLSVWSLIVVVIVLVCALQSGRPRQVLTLGLTTTLFSFAAILAPYVYDLDHNAVADARGGAATYQLIVISDSLLDYPDVPATTWIRAEKQLIERRRKSEPPSFAPAADPLNSYLSDRVDCANRTDDAPTAPAYVNEKMWAEATSARRDRVARLCVKLTANFGAGLSRSLYVLALFILGVLYAPWAEARLRPADYGAGVIRLVDRTSLAALLVGAVIVLIML